MDKVEILPQLEIIDTLAVHVRHSQAARVAILETLIDVGIGGQEAVSLQITLAILHSILIKY